jgi:hypothetical protein
MNIKRLIYIVMVFSIVLTGCTGIVAGAGNIVNINDTPTEIFTNTSKIEQPILGNTEKPTSEPKSAPTETKKIETPEPTHTETPKPMEMPVSPIFEKEENNKVSVFFGDFYRELPLSKQVETMVIPDSIVIHTDDQSGDYPEKWNTMTTFYGLGTTKSVHFAVSQDGIAQMLPMEEVRVKRANGVLEQWDDNGDWLDYDGHSIQIEMGGRNYNHLVTGEASPVMVEVIEITTKKTIDLVISLMIFYDIPYENIVGHYQIGRGKTDPGNIYFEEYFLPLLKEELEKYNNGLD